jgi:manganese/zinc/iron transport system substrate-binding protein
MPFKMCWILFFSVLLGSLSILWVGNTFHADNERSTQYTIVVTTTILADIVYNIVGEAITVYNLMGPGIDPHVYRARESDVHKLAAADMIIYNGLHLEGKMEHLLAGMNRFCLVVNASEGIDKKKLRYADGDNIYDPHIWFDVLLFIDLVRHIQQHIITLDAKHAEIYIKNGNHYIKKLQELDRSVREQIATIDIQKRILITAHDAFGYFGAAYGFKVVGLQGLSTDSDISIKDVQKLADYIVAKKVPTIFIETSIPERTLQAVQNAVLKKGWTVSLGDELYSDALGDKLTKAATYIDMIQYTVDTITKGLMR